MTTAAPSRRTRLISPAAAYAAALRGSPYRIHGLPEPNTVFDLTRWCAPADNADGELLRRCTGSTVDIGCGPGRMTEALLARGVVALGIDVVPEAVARTRARGAAALVRDVFAALPAEGRWSTALLADGNIGIGGDPVRLLRRIAQLLRPGGRVVLDLAPPGGRVSVHDVVLEVGGNRTPALRWAVVPADGIAALAEAASLRVLEVVAPRGRWLAELTKPG